MRRIHRDCLGRQERKDSYHFYHFRLGKGGRMEEEMEKRGEFDIGGPRGGGGEKGRGRVKEEDNSDQ